MPGQSRSRIVLVHILSFVALAILVWVDEALDLPHHLLGAARSDQRIEEALLECTAIVLVGTFVVAWVATTVRRVAYLENFIVLCAWCRRIRLDDEWLPLEHYLARHEATMSHGMCPACSAKMTNDAA